MKYLTYPRTPRKLDKRYKLSEKDIELIKIYRKDGLSYRHIGHIFGVSHTAIVEKFWSKDKLKQKRSDANKRIRERIKQDPTLKEKVRLRDKTHREYKKKTQYIEFRAYERSRGK